MSKSVYFSFLHCNKQEVDEQTINLERIDELIPFLEACPEATPGTVFVYSYDSSPIPFHALVVKEQNGKKVVVDKEVEAKFFLAGSITPI